MKVVNIKTMARYVIGVRRGHQAPHPFLQVVSLARGRGICAVPIIRRGGAAKVYNV